jgi:hypothetical protein
MVKALLIRGMLAGVIAGVLAFGFARIFGEPEIEYAIGFEEQLTNVAGTEAHAIGTMHEHEEELLSRDMQAGIGLLTAVVVYGAGIGGLFAIVFAFAYGRLGHFGPRATAALLAAAGFVSIGFVPFLKYPANPPSVGSAETLGSRTALFLIMIAISIAAIALAMSLARRLVVRVGPWASAAIGALSFIVIVGIAQLILPDVSEVPTAFSADSLWRFRAASLGMQMLMWATLGIAFGALSARLLNQPNA